jgi:uncharacterized cofD-like protein
MTNSNLTKVVVMGGGTGTFPVIRALAQLPVLITSIIAVSDSGGSTGRIRDEFGFQPVGDLRQSLAALAEHRGEEWIRRILLYRFSKGEGLKGHNLGNLILTALQDMTGSTGEALRIAERVFRLKGKVIPVTDENVQLVIHYQDGSTQVGEHVLDETPESIKKIDHVSLSPTANLSPRARKALLEADLIIIGPGDYYASLMATLCVQDLPAVMAQTSAQTLYILNLMTRLTQTAEMSAQDHVLGIEAALERKLDHVLVNTDVIPDPILAHYASEGEHPVSDDLGEDARVLRAPLVSQESYQKMAVDTTHRSLLRHDGDKLREALSSMLEKLS